MSNYYFSSLTAPFPVQWVNHRGMWRIDEYFEFTVFHAVYFAEEFASSMHFPGMGNSKCIEKERFHSECRI